MKAKQFAMQLLLVCLGIFLATATNLAIAATVEPSRSNPVAPAAPLSDVEGAMSVQGYLTNSSGSPLNGPYNMTFKIYDVSSGGTALCTSALAGVQVSNGQFGATIFCSVMDGQQLWLGITVGADSEMTPRQPIRPAAYAMSLRPGAVISSTLGGSPIVHIENWGNAGRGLRVYAMDTASVNYAIVGASRSSTGYAGYFYNDGGGTGVWARSIDNGNDLILGGNANSTLGDDGILSSDPNYASSDLILRTNDGVRVELDHDGNGEAADFQIVDKDSTTIFNVSNTGALTSAFPRPAFDSGWTTVAQDATYTFNHSLGGNRDDYIVDLTCKTSGASGVNARDLGGNAAYAWNTLYLYGAYWKELTTSSIKVFRNRDDDACEQARVRIWIIK